MQRIYSKDECAPDARSAWRWLAEEKNACRGLTSVELAAGDTSWTVFQHAGTFYVLEFSCGVYEDVFTATREEVGALIDKARDQLLGVKDEN
jgi:hypothetical protein